MKIKQSLKILLKKYIAKSDFDLSAISVVDKHTLEISFVDSEDRQFKVYYDKLSESNHVYTIISAGLYKDDIKLIYKITKKLSKSKVQNMLLKELVR